MTTVKRSALVPYAAEQMYALVNDVEAYPEFVPWCTGVKVLVRNRSTLQATIALEKGAISQRLTTQNVMHEGHRIDMKLVEGPFRYLHGTWLFEALGAEASEVSLQMRFEASRTLVGVAFGQVFNQVANSLVDAFCRRAAERFGKR